MDNKNDSKSPGRFRSKEEWEEYKNKLIAEAQAIKGKPKTSDKKNPAPIIAPTEKKCPKCAMMIPSEAKICPHCRTKLGMSVGVLFLILTGSLFVIGIIVSSISDKNPNPSSTTTSSDDFHKKYIFVKALDETTYKEMGGIFNKVEIGTTDRVEITLDIRNKEVYMLAKEFAPKFKEVGFKILRIKDTYSDRYEDFAL